MIQTESLTVPPLGWLSVLSLDAVLVAVTWQIAYTRYFLGRSSSVSEAGVLGGVVWLIYVADRMMDGKNLDLSQPHTLRHRFYQQHARPFGIIWVVVLIVVAITTVTCLTMGLLQTGLMLATAVFVYGAGVHFIPRHGESLDTMFARSWYQGWLPAKEIQVGCLFAIGVTLVCWTEMLWQPGVAVDPFPWLLAGGTVLAGAVFSTNCILVAFWESSIDRAQRFNSICSKAETRQFGVSGSQTLFDRRGIYIDAVLWVPAMLLVIFY